MVSRWVSRAIHTLKQHRQQGQVLIMAALCMTVLIGFVALSVDVGYALTERRGLQTAADASALAVGQAVMSGATSQSTYDATANSYITGNGFPDADASVVVAGTSTVKTVTVNLSNDVPKYFIGAIYHGNWSVGAQAVATVYLKPANYALLVLKNSGYPATFTGNVNLYVQDGGAMSNGAMKCTGNGSIYAEETMDANLGFKAIGNCGFSGGKGSNSAASVVDDPLKNVPPPPKPSQPGIGLSVTCSNTGTVFKPAYSCPPGALYSGVSVSGNDPSITFAAGNHQIINSTISATGNGGTITLNPGTYYFKNSDLKITGNDGSLVFNPGKYLFYMEDGSMTFNGNSNGFDTSDIDVEFYFKDSDVQFTGNTSGSIPPGIYYFDGDGPRLTGNQKVTGSDVLFFMDNGASFDTTGNTGYSFTAASKSLYTGGQDHMLIYSARGSVSTFKMTGNSGTNLDGIVYLPDAALQMTGNTSGIWAQGQLIVNTITNTGNTNVKIKYKDYVNMTTPKVYLTQ